MGERTLPHDRILEPSSPGPAVTPNDENAEPETHPLIVSSSPTTPEPKKQPLTLLNGLALVIALQIGSGIFTLPTQVSQSVPSPGAGLIVWLLAGLLVWTGAASFIELGCRAPSNGGIQEYVRVAYGTGARTYDDYHEGEEGFDGAELDEGDTTQGDAGESRPALAATELPAGSSDDKVGPRGELAGFVFTWTWVILAKPAANGAISTIAANYLARPFLPDPSSSSSSAAAGLSPLASRLTALACVGFLTLVNCLGATSGAKAANVFLMLKLSALGSIILMGLFALVTGWHADGVPASETGWFGWSEADRKTPAWELLGEFVTATFGAVFCYGGWETVRDTPHNHRIGLFGGLGAR